MPVRDIADEILETAGADHVARRPAAEVIEFPLVSPWLKREKREPMPDAVPLTDPPKVHTPMPLWLRAVKYTALLACFALGAWLYSTERREGILADIGKTTCSADMSIMWLEEDPGSDVPRLKDEVLRRCAMAYELF